jgi:hypothetical protein
MKHGNRDSSGAWNYLDLGTFNILLTILGYIPGIVTPLGNRKILARPTAPFS